MPDRPGVSVSNREVLSTERYVLWVDISPLTIGHVILIPRSHSLNFAGLWADEPTQLRDAVSQVVDVLEQHFDSAGLVLEHGSTKRDDAGGCIAHAHLHFVPGATDIDDALAPYGPRAIGGFDELADAVGHDQAYVFAGSPTGVGVIATHDLHQMPKQFIRIALAQQLGIPDPEWDWRTHIAEERLRATVGLLGAGRTPDG
jgi:diadenosine tetraphosphate (Ap4A) HIT family hydrolase